MAVKLNRRNNQPEEIIIQEETYEYEGPKENVVKRNQKNRISKLNRLKEIKPITLFQMDGLTGKERNFVREYLKEYNGTKAAIAVGYSEATASVIAYQLLRKPQIIAAIEQVEKGLATRFINTKEKVLKEMSILAFSDIGDFLTEEGDIKVKNLKELPPQITRCIRKIRMHKKSRILGKKTLDGNMGDEIIEQHIDLELYDKKAALDRMGQQVGIFVDRKELTGPDGKDLIPTPTTLVIDFGIGDESTDK